MARRPKTREVKETAMTAGERLAVVFAVVVSLFGFVILVGVLIQILEGPRSTPSSPTSCSRSFWVSCLWPRE